MSIENIDYLQSRTSVSLCRVSGFSNEHLKDERFDADEEGFNYKDGLW